MNVFKNSSEAVKAILDLHFPEGRILDPTGSYGVFYKLVSGREVTRGDIRPEVMPDYVGDFRSLGFADDSFDVVFFDPPYKRGSRKTGKTSDHYSERYGKAPNNENACTKQYFEALQEIIRVASSGIVIKLQDAADGHSFHDRRYQISRRVEELTGLKPHDVALVYRPGAIKTLTNGKRRFFRQQVSYFVVWKWKSKGTIFTRCSF